MAIIRQKRSIRSLIPEEARRDVELSSRYDPSELNEGMMNLLQEVPPEEIELFNPANLRKMELFIDSVESKKSRATEQYEKQMEKHNSQQRDYENILPKVRALSNMMEEIQQKGLKNSKQTIFDFYATQIRQNKRRRIIYEEKQEEQQEEELEEEKQEESDEEKLEEEEEKQQEDDEDEKQQEELEEEEKSFYEEGEEELDKIGEMTIK